MVVIGLLLCDDYDDGGGCDSFLRVAIQQWRHIIATEIEREKLEP